MYYSRVLVRRIAGLLCAALLIPSAAHGFPFGGQITLFHVCYNETIFARLSPPVPGDYVYAEGYTKVYQFGPPRSTGQWLLGLTGIPFDCLWSVNPILPVPAIAITMMGSSQAGPLRLSSGGYTADPTQLRGGSGGFGNPNPTYTGAPQYTGTPSPGGGTVRDILITEVYSHVDAGHGVDPTHEWVELYNNTSASIDISGWTILNASSSDTLASGTTIGAGSFLLITEGTALRNYWSIPSHVRIAALGSPIGSGLARAGDAVFLKNTSGATIDSVSWGTNVSAFNPSATTIPVGHSLSRNSIFTDTNSAADWADKAMPTPGN